MRFILSILFIFISFISCKKETLNDSDKIQQELKEIINKNSISRVVPVFEESGFSNRINYLAGKDYKFNNGFVEITGFFYDSYNLKDLKSYKISKIYIDSPDNKTTIETALLLYFQYID